MIRILIALLTSAGISVAANASPASNIKFHYATDQVDCESIHDAKKFTQAQIENSSNFLHAIAGRSMIDGISLACGEFSTCPAFASKASAILEENRTWIKNTKALVVPKEIIPIKELIMAENESRQLFAEATLIYYKSNDINAFKNPNILADIKKCSGLLDKLVLEKDKKAKDHILLYDLAGCMNQYESIPEEDINKAWKQITLNEVCEDITYANE